MLVLVISRLCRISILFIATLIAAGCARFPEGSTPTTIREMSFNIEFNGPINDTDWYFIPIDSAGGGTGPVPVFPGIAVGEGWVTGSATHYIQYHQRQYTVFEITSLQPFASKYIGSPLRVTVPDAGQNTLQFTIDLNQIGATGDTLDFNIICTDQPFGSVRLLDALGRLGNDFANVDIRTNQPITNSEGLNPESPDVLDVLDQNRSIQQSNDQTKPLDITDWSVTLNL